jgi:hypothetical protein
MRRQPHILITLGIAALLGACSGSKSFSKKGDKLDAAGMYAEAADMYLPIRAAERQERGCQDRLEARQGSRYAER